MAEIRFRLIPEEAGDPELAIDIYKDDGGFAASATVDVLSEITPEKIVTALQVLVKHWHQAQLKA
jgi:hypothetical protein